VCATQDTRRCNCNENSCQHQDQELDSIHAFPAISIGEYSNNELPDESTNKHSEIEKQFSPAAHGSTPVNDIDHGKNSVNSKDLSSWSAFDMTANAQGDSYIVCIGEESSSWKNLATVLQRDQRARKFTCHKGCPCRKFAYQSQ
jgi:4-hydroxyphenylpyruvate dioxygenase-like putative hemolysin